MTSRPCFPDITFTVLVLLTSGPHPCGPYVRCMPRAEVLRHRYVSFSGSFRLLLNRDANTWGVEFLGMASSAVPLLRLGGGGMLDAAAAAAAAAATAGAETPFPSAVGETPRFWPATVAPPGPGEVARPPPFWCPASWSLPDVPSPASAPVAPVVSAPALLFSLASFLLLFFSFSAATRAAAFALRESACSPVGLTGSSSSELHLRPNSSCTTAGASLIAFSLTVCPVGRNVTNLYLPLNSTPVTGQQKGESLLGPLEPCDAADCGFPCRGFLSNLSSITCLRLLMYENCGGMDLLRRALTMASLLNKVPTSSMTTGGVNVSPVRWHRVQRASSSSTGLTLSFFFPAYISR
mmetsp:Transcript_27472/g.60092  ORF Transcript_27472/g.60092 Transcript_27472/m.60092 type:complete len:351 (-) Transcript_27472:377-1429(-)